MRPLIKTALLYVLYVAGMYLGNRKGAYEKHINNNVLSYGMYRMYPKIKFQTEEYKYIYIIGRMAPYIGFGRKRRIRYIQKRNRLFFLNNWYDARFSQGTYAGVPRCIRAANSLKLPAFSTYWGCCSFSSQKHLHDRQYKRPETQFLNLICCGYVSIAPTLEQKFFFIGFFFSHRFGDFHAEVFLSPIYDHLEPHPQAICCENTSWGVEWHRYEQKAQCNSKSQQSENSKGHLNNILRKRRKRLQKIIHAVLQISFRVDRASKVSGLGCAIQHHITGLFNDWEFVT